MTSARAGSGRMSGAAIAELVVVGAGSGGVESLLGFIAGLPGEGIPAPIVAVFAREPGASAPPGTVEALDKDELVPGRIHVGPAGYHLLVEAPHLGGDHGHLVLSTEPPVDGARPSLDALLESAVVAFGARVTAVILAGQGKDGVRGAVLVKRAGGTVFVESPGTASRRELPAAVIDDLPQVDGALPLAALPLAVADRSKVGHG